MGAGVLGSSPRDLLPWILGLPPSMEAEFKEHEAEADGIFMTQPQSSHNITSTEPYCRRQSPRFEGSKCRVHLSVGKWQGLREQVEGELWMRSSSGNMISNKNRVTMAVPP